MKKLFFLLTVLIINSCEAPEVTYDPTIQLKIANEANKYLYDCPEFFMPPVFGNTNGTLKNQLGAVAWTPSGVTGNPSMVETKERYISRLTLATQENQTSWFEYQQLQNSGYPGMDNANPEITYQTGFVCYSIVYNAFKSAGYNLWSTFPVNCDALIEEMTEYSIEEAVVGDVVVFNWDNSYGTTGTWWDHAGIIVNKDATDPKDWLIVSSLGIIEIFKYGAKKSRLGVFGSTNGGEFTSWDPDLENWSYKIFG